MDLLLGFLFSSIDLLCLFLCQYHTVLIRVALLYNLKLGCVIPLALFFFLKIALAIWGLCGFTQILGFFPPLSVKHATGILTVVLSNL